VKILFILGSFFPAQSGGPNNTTYWAVKELAQRGVEVTVASLKDGLTPKNLDSYGIALNRENRLDGIKSWYFDYGASRYLSLAMSRWLLTNIKQYDMVNLTSVFFPWTWIAALLCILFRIPFSIAPRGELEPGAYRYGKGRKQLFSRLFIKRLMAKARFVLVTSEQEEHYSRSYFPEGMPFEIVPNYMELERVTPAPEAIRQKRDILYIGRIHPKKGIENLIRAFELVNGKLLGGHQLLIAGSGENAYMESLVKLAEQSKRSDAIHFLGHKIEKEKEDVYKKAKVMVLPSYSENFGNVVVEALAHATPVIASRFTPWFGLEKKKCGLWVDNDPHSLVQAIESILLLDETAYIAMAEAARCFVEETYDVRKNGGRLEALYRGYLS